MANYLKMKQRQQVLALLELGWTYRRIEAETGVRRETVSRYDRECRANAAKVFLGSERSPCTAREFTSPILPADWESLVSRYPGGSRRCKRRARQASSASRVLEDLPS